MVHLDEPGAVIVVGEPTTWLHPVRLVAGRATVTAQYLADSVGA